MKSGQIVVVTALRHLGDTEDPFGSNTDQGGWIDSIQADWHLHKVPWCGCAVDAWFREAGVDDGGVGSPSTAAICSTARARGWLWKKGTIPGGAIWVNCGTHVELVVADRGNGLLDTIGGNVNQAVRKCTRRVSDGVIVIPPAILEGVDEPVRMYGFQDLSLRPRRYGGWNTKTRRENVIKKLPQDLRKQVHRVNVGGKSPFAFVIYPRTNQRWQLGPWDSKDVRDRIMREYRISHLRHRIRPYSIDINSLTGTGGVTQGDIQT